MISAGKAGALLFQKAFLNDFLFEGLQPRGPKLQRRIALSKILDDNLFKSDKNILCRKESGHDSTGQAGPVSRTGQAHIVDFPD